MVKRKRGIAGVIDVLVITPMRSVVRRVMRLPSYWGRQIDASLVNNISVATGRVLKGNIPRRKEVAAPKDRLLSSAPLFSRGKPNNRNLRLTHRFYDEL